METTGVQSTSSTQSTQSTRTTGNFDLLDKNQFMKLFIAELENQDPLEPLQTNDLTTQLAQLSIVEQSEHMSKSFDELLDIQRSMALELTSLKERISMDNTFATYASFIGKQGSWLNAEGEENTGTIDSVISRKSQFYAVINSEEIPVTEIFRISQGVNGAESDI